MPLAAIQLVNAEIGTVSSRVDGSVKFTVITAELRPSEKGLCMEYHGKACKVTIEPHEGEPPEIVKVDTELHSKTPGQRLRAVLFVAFQQQKPQVTFEDFYNRKLDAIINEIKMTLT